MGKKTNWSQFKEKSKTEQNLRKSIDGKIEQYSDNDIVDQINMLKKAIEYIKTRRNEGIELNDLKNEFQMHMSHVFSKIKSPSLNDFYRKKTLEYILKNNISVESVIRQILESQKNIQELAKKANFKENAYSGNITKNMDIFMCEQICDLLKYKYSISEKFNNMRAKIQNNKLTVEDATLLASYVEQLIQEQKLGRQEQASKIVKNDLDSLYMKLIKNIDDFFEIEEFNDIPIQRRLSKKDTEEIPELPSSTNISKIQRNILRPIRKTKVSLKKCIKNPFISTDKENNLKIYIYSLLNLFEREGQLQDFYDILIRGKESKETIKLLLSANLKYPTTAMNIKALLNDRLCALIKLFEESGELDKYNKRNNKILSNIGADKLCISTEDLLKILYNLSNSDLVEIDQLNAMSALYLNRLAKILPMFTRRKFILDKKNVIERIYENPNLTFEDFNFSEEELRLYMAQYDTLQDIVKRDYIDSMSQAEFEKVEYDEKTYKKAKEMVKTALSPYLEPYYQMYEKNPDRVINDMDNVITSCELLRLFYNLKDYSVKSLIYTAIMDKDSDIINWGYVPDDPNGDDKKILLGFDIKYLNMPIFVHLDRADVEKTIREITNDVIIPVYSGDIDFDISQGRRMTTQVSYPFASKQRKILSNIKGRKTVIEHLKWLQKPSNRPSFISEPGRKKYNISTGEIITLKSKKAENPDSQSL